jgi:hypothetical protein
MRAFRSIVTLGALAVLVALAFSAGPGTVIAFSTL